jgi:rfaE bifunctional protein nucleotidyltransferase chain/domain/rfaE bifunctional protein kinase chain/domain
MNAPLVIVGDAMLDRDVDGTAERLSPEAPVPVLDESRASVRPGGAALAAVVAAGDGGRVVLVTALSADAAGRELRTLIEAAGVEVVDLGLDGPTPVKIRLRAGGRTLLRHDRNCQVRPGIVDEAAAEGAFAQAAGVLVADYGRGITSHGHVRRSLQAAAASLPTVWDPHPGGREPVAGVTLATPNRSEAAGFVREVRGDGLRATAARADALRRRWECAAVAVTLGGEGALLADGGATPRVFPTTAAGEDACGAGDRFSSAAAAALAAGANPPEAIAAAVDEASAFVAAGGACALPHEPDVVSVDGWARALEVAERTRRRGGTVVATGGCFDLLHPGHVATLAGARALGDCLVVLLNSDASVSRLKGPGRPVVPERDRAEVLAALRCVDAVVVFDEDTPEAALGRLRPDVFTKGGDYRGRAIPEEAVMRAFGGQVVLLPVVSGRSTTRLIERAEVSRER